MPSTEANLIPEKLSSPSLMTRSGFTAVITGAGSGIGRAISVVCSEMGAACVIGADISRDSLRVTQELVNAVNPDCVFVPQVCDASLSGCAEMLLQSALSVEGGRMDVWLVMV